MSAESSTILQTIEAYLDAVTLSRSENTARTYRNAMTMFAEILVLHKVDPDKLPLASLKEDAVIRMANALKDFSPATEQI